MPYCFDFTFNFFLYLVNVFEEKKKKQPKERRNGKERADVAGILVCALVGSVLQEEVSGCAWHSSELGIFASSRDGVGAKVLSQCVYIPWRAVHSPVPAHRH